MIAQMAQGFWAHGNFLASLPLDFGKLVNLHTISLAGNKLTNLPKSLSGLVKLRDLGLQGNELSQVPAEMGALSEPSTFICIIVAAMPYATLAVPAAVYCAMSCCAVLCHAMPSLVMRQKDLEQEVLQLGVRAQACLPIRSPGLLGKTPTSQNVLHHDLWRLTPGYAMRFTQ